MGEVFLGWDERLERRVAIKRIRHDANVTPEHRERFRREARTLAGLSHPAIVQVYDIVEDTSGDCLVMEYVEGPTLARLLADGVMDLPTAVGLAREVAEGLAEAHAKGLVHRDLKAENVVVSAGGHAKILDFGLAKQLGDTAYDDTLTAHGALVGTSRTMSPEQACGAAVDHRSDLFSLGVLLYEMTTGRSPFAASSQPETLRRILSEKHRPADQLRADLPPRLSELIDQLLAKDPEDRPGSSRRVALELAEIATALGSGDRPTESLELSPSGGFWRTSSTSSWRSSRAHDPPALRRARSVALAGSLILTLVVVGAGYFIWREPEAPLRVVMAAPEVPAGADEELHLVATAVRSAGLGHLAAMRGIDALDPRARAGLPSAPAELAMALGADEVVTGELERWAEGSCHLTLRRLRGSDGSVLWAESFEVLPGPEDLPLLADTLGIYLERAYDTEAASPGAPRLEVEDRDYAAFLEIKRRVDRGLDGGDLEAELDRLEDVLEGSPRFVEAYLLASELALRLHERGRSPARLAVARALSEQAAALRPGDPRPLELGFRIAVAAGELEAAETALDKLRRLTPGSVELLSLSAKLALARGETDRALEGFRRALDRLRSWENLRELADLEAELGRIGEARRHLEEILASAPENFWGMEQLAELELVYGDLERARELYLELAEKRPNLVVLSALGIVEYLLGHYADAAESQRRAFELAPDNPVVTFNLAEAEWQVGRRERARRLFERVLEQLAELEATSSLDARDLMLRALSLAYSGAAEEAVALTQETLQRNPENSETIYQAAVAYALVGERTSTLVNVRRALDGGYQARWFEIPAFDTLRDDPDFPELPAQDSSRARAKSSE